MRLISITVRVLVLMLSCGATGVAAADSSTAPDDPPGYRVQQLLLPMRDGVRLGTVIVRPVTQRSDLPIVLMRTKFAIDEKTSVVRQFETTWRELAEDGYIFVLQNVRGRFRSEGDYVLYRGVRDKADPGSTDDSTDAFDTIDWLVKNVAGNNGRVGVMGGSQPGTLAAMALIDSHPALKAASPQAPALNHFVGDDFFHHGAFNLSPSYDYAQWSYWAQKSPVSPRTDLVGYDFKDTFEFFRRRTPIERIDTERFERKMWIWNELTAHPTLDDFWRPRQIDKLIEAATTPTLIVGGWFDVQDAYGQVALFRKLKKNDERGLVRIAMGPWLHNEWMRAPDGGRKLLGFDFGSATAEHYRQNILGAFFARHLKELPVAELPTATMYQTGSNRWQKYDAFPPRATRKMRLYFAADGRLTIDQKPQQDSVFDTYISDPLNPVPHAPRPIPPYYTDEGQMWKLMDQRFAHKRPDTVSYETEVLQHDVTLSGNITAQLYASTSGTDVDWVVKLIDVHPEGERSELAGYQYLVAAEILRAKFREDYSRPQPLQPGKVTHFSIDLLQRDHVFRRGHRILVQVQSSWFPLFDANPGRYANIMKARLEDFQKTTQRIFRARNEPSHIEIDVAPPSSSTHE